MANAKIKKKKRSEGRKIKPFVLRLAQCRLILQITEKINEGLTLDQVLNHVYDSLKLIIPYDRIGFSLLENHDRTVKAHWSRSVSDHICLPAGYSAHIKGSSLESVLKTGRPRVINDLEKHLKTHPSSDSTRRILKEGMRSSLTCPLIAQGRPIGFLFFSSMKPRTYQDVHSEIFMTIAGQLAVIAEKSKLYEKLFELNELKNKFLGIAAHDLRSPLTTMAGYLELYLEGLLGALTDHQKEAIHVMQHSCDNMLALVNNLLEVSVIESGRMELEKTPVSLAQFMKDCYDANEIIVKAKNMELILELDSDLPSVQADPDRLTQVFNNLISNAVKFSNPHTSIKFKAHRRGAKEVVISVEDQGQGIVEGELPSLFAAFGKTTTKPTAQERSTGLGLAIARSIVEAHGGKIWVESLPGKGSTFFVSLPSTVGAGQ